MGLSMSPLLVSVQHDIVNCINVSIQQLKYISIRKQSGDFFVKSAATKCRYSLRLRSVRAAAEGNEGSHEVTDAVVLRVNEVVRISIEEAS